MYEFALTHIYFLPLPLVFLVYYIFGMCVKAVCGIARSCRYTHTRLAALGTVMSPAPAFSMVTCNPPLMCSIWQPDTPLCSVQKQYPSVNWLCKSKPWQMYILVGAFQAIGVTYFPIYTMPCHEIHAVPWNVMQCIQCHEVSCSDIQCPTVSCSDIQCPTVPCSDLQCPTVPCSDMLTHLGDIQCPTVSWCVMQCHAVPYSVLLCPAVTCWHI